MKLISVANTEKISFEQAKVRNLLFLVNQIIFTIFKEKANTRQFSGGL